MAVAVDVLNNVRSEVENRIKALVPNQMVSQNCPFSIHKNAKTSITDMKGKSRLFDIGMFVEGKHWHIGYTTRGVLYTADIIFLYARGRVWNAAAVDDMHAINCDLLLNPTSVDGCGLRVLEQGPPLFAVTQRTDDTWDYYTVKLNCFASVKTTRG